MSTPNIPLVSIGMPVRNAETTIALTIRSILIQTFSNWELLITDDGSTDQTRQIIAQFNDPRIRIWSDGKHQGLAPRLNELIEKSRGKYFARMDSDDIAYPTRLEKQLTYLEENPIIDLVGSAAIVFGAHGKAFGKRLPPKQHVNICARAHVGFPMIHPTWLGHRAWFERHQYRNIAIRCEDQDLLLRAHTSSRYANIPSILLGYREEKINLSKILLGRRYHSELYFNYMMKRHRTWSAFYGLMEQISKSILDVFAVGTGLNYRVLRQRAHPISDEEKVTWAKVWQSVQPLGNNP